MVKRAGREYLLCCGSLSIGDFVLICFSFLGSNAFLPKKYLTSPDLR